MAPVFPSWDAGFDAIAKFRRTQLPGPVDFRRVPPVAGKTLPADSAELPELVRAQLV